MNIYSGNFIGVSWVIFFKKAGGGHGSVTVSNCSREAALASSRVTDFVRANLVSVQRVTSFAY